MRFDNLGIEIRAEELGGLGQPKEHIDCTLKFDTNTIGTECAVSSMVLRCC